MSVWYRTRSRSYTGTCTEPETHRRTEERDDFGQEEIRRIRREATQHSTAPKHSLNSTRAAESIRGLPLHALPTALEPTSTTSPLTPYTLFLSRIPSVCVPFHPLNLPPPRFSSAFFYLRFLLFFSSLLFLHLFLCCFDATPIDPPGHANL